ncbi:MAG: CotS family spore coat protein [Chitinophagales bacterium]
MLNRAIPEHPGAPWGLEVTGVVPVRGAWRLDCGERSFLLKPVRLSARERVFVAAALDYLTERGYCTPRPVPTPDGKTVARLGRRHYQLFAWQPGEEADYLVPGHAEAAAQALAGLHAASTGFRPPFPRHRVLHGTWPRRLARRLQDLRRFAGEARAAAPATPFAQEYARLAPAWQRAAERALAELAASPYRALAAAAARRGGLCHHDPAHHNVLLTAGGPVLVDFDYAVADFGIHDLANLLRRVLRLTGWDAGRALAVVEAYRTAAPMGQAEAAVLLPLLRFPEDAWMLGRQHFVERRAWPAERYLEALARKSDTAPERDLCLASLARQLLAETKGGCRLA